MSLPVHPPGGDGQLGRVVVLTCRVLSSALERVMPQALAAEVKTLDYGLHRVPVKLTAAVQAALDEIEEPSIVMLGYGLCGNGLRGIRAGEHTLLIPRTDDCIAILLGSYRAYMREFGTVPGTYYLTKGWLESGSNPLQEYHEYSVKYGPDTAMWLVDQQYRHYERIALVAPHEEEMATYRAQAQEVARFCERWGMRYEEILGSDEYVARLVSATMLLKTHGLAAADRVGSDFVVIPPGGEIEQAMFMR